MKIGVDIDEVIAEFVKSFLEWYNQKNKTDFKYEDITSYNFWEVLPITKEEAYKLVEDFFKHPSSENLDSPENSIEIINKFAKDNEIIFITSRKLDFKEKTNKFIEKCFPDNKFRVLFLNEMYAGQSATKADICLNEGIGVLIEDNAEYSENYAEKGIKVLLLDKPWNKNAKEHENIKKVYNWEDIEKEIEKLKEKEEQSKKQQEADIIEKIRKFVEEECKKPTSHYGEEVFVCHFVPVVEYSKILANNLNKEAKDENEKTDLEIVELAAWLHDIGSIMIGREKHHETGAKIAETKLTELGYDKNKTEKVKKCIFNHRGSMTFERKTKEEQIIADADSLSAFDNISGLFKAAIFHEGFNQVEAKREVRKKLINSWQKLSSTAKKIIEHKYLAAMILLGEEKFGGGFRDG